VFGNAVFDTALDYGLNQEADTEAATVLGCLLA
jgi:hypothetical protein